MVIRFINLKFDQMSKRGKKLTKAINRREYIIALKQYDTYCIICDRRVGRFNTYCGYIPSVKNNKNWKQYRKKQWRV